jgi:hypothetical protein
MSGCVKRLRDEHQTEDEFQTGFYGLGVGFDLVTGGRRGPCPYELLIGQARARSYLQRNYADPAPRNPAPEAATSLQQVHVTRSRLDTNKEELNNMNREDCRRSYLWHALTIATFGDIVVRCWRCSKLCAEYREPSQRSNGVES